MSDPLPAITLYKDKTFLGFKVGEERVSIGIIFDARHGYSTVVSGRLSVVTPHDNDLEKARHDYSDEIERYEKHGYSKC